MGLGWIWGLPVGNFVGFGEGKSVRVGNAVGKCNTGFVGNRGNAIEGAEVGSLDNSNDGDFEGFEEGKLDRVGNIVGVLSNRSRLPAAE